MKNFLKQSSYSSLKYNIAIAGAVQIKHCCPRIIKISKQMDREIARQKCMLVTGATTGVPYYAAQGYKEAGGFNVSFSPAASEAAHLKTYKCRLTPLTL